MNTRTRTSDQGESPDSEAHSRSSGYAGRSPEEIESEIERTRKGVGQTLDELEARLSPRKRLHAAGDSARQLAQRFAQSAAGAMSPSVTAMIRLDHTHVLALLRRFRPWTSRRRKQALVANACLALEVHATLEEEIFYPALREAAGRNEVLDRSVPEHDEIGRAIAQLRTTEIADPDFDEMFRTLMRTVLHHVADEETVVLPLAESCMADRLGMLGFAMTRRRMQLLGPDIGKVVATTATSFPVLAAAAAGGMLALAWMAIRTPRRSRSIRHRR